MKRIKVSGATAVYHCIARIVGGEIVLGDEEKERFRKLMWQLAEFSEIEIITYCLMGNHVHLLVRAPSSVSLSDAELCRRVVTYYGRREPWVQLLDQEFRRTGVINPQLRKRLLARMGDVSVFMRTLKQRFSRWYNRRNKRFGTLWAERFKSLLVEDHSESLRTVAMYIDLNPVRAGLVDDPKDYRFCGHAEAVVGNKKIRRNTVAMCEGNNWRSARGEYRSVMMVYAADEDRGDRRSISRNQLLRVLEKGGDLDRPEVLRLRLRHLTDGVVLGSREFVEEVFAEFRDRFGCRREQGAKPIRMGRGIGELHTVRDLKKSTVS